MAYLQMSHEVTGTLVTSALYNQLVDNDIALSAALLIPAHRSGRYYTSQATIDSGITAIATAGFLYGLPITIPNAGNYDDIGVVINAGAAGNAHLGIYADNGGVPGALIVDAGAVAVIVTLTHLALTFTGVTAQLIWLAVIFSGTPTPNRLVGTGLNPTQTTPGSTPTPFSSGVVRTTSYGALPDPFGTITGVVQAPAIYIRRT